MDKQAIFADSVYFGLEWKYAPPTAADLVPAPVDLVTGQIRLWQLWLKMERTKINVQRKLVGLPPLEDL